MVVEEEEEVEFEEKMVPASTSLTSSAPLDLSLLREDFQGKHLWMMMNERVIDSFGRRLLSQVNEYSCKFFGYSVIHHGRLCVIGTPEKPSLLLHCVNKDIY